MKLRFQEENLSKKQECSALTGNLEGTALSCVMGKRVNERDSARKIFETLLNRFGSVVQGHQAMVKFEKRRQRDDESIDKFLDDLELLRRRSNPDERISERNGNYSGTHTGANSSWYRPRDDMDKRRSCANFCSMDHHVSSCSTYKQNMEPIGYFLGDVDATDEDHEEYVRGLIMKYGPRCFFCNLEGHFKSDCTHFWDAVADAKHPRQEEALSGGQG